MLINQHLKMVKLYFQKELLIVARFQTVLCQNLNVDIKTHVVASVLNRIADKLISLQTIKWYTLAHKHQFKIFYSRRGVKLIIYTD